MIGRIRYTLSAGLAVSGLLVVWVGLQRRPEKPPNHLANVRATFAQVPLAFEANSGQTDPQARFLARGAGYTIFLTPDETVLSLLDRQHRSAVIRLQLAGANPKPEMHPLDELPGKSNYFIGNNPKLWRTDIPLYAKVRYRQAYPGIDIVYHGSQRQLEYDFVIAPDADPAAIKLNFTGADKIDLDSEGNLVFQAGSGELLLRKPLAYQEINGRRQEVGVAYILEKSQAQLKLAKYDNSKELVIDPVFLYSTYLGGSGNDQANAIAVDALGNAYVAGQTNSFDFPVTPGAPQGLQPSDTANSNPSAFVTKLNPSGNQIIYSTYIGGSCTDIAFGIAIDAAGEGVRHRNNRLRDQSAERKSGLRPVE